MNRITLFLVICMLLSPVCVAETAGDSQSSADRFLSDLSDTWDSFLGMVGDAGKDVADWAEKTTNDFDAWARESGLTDWADEAVGKIDAWFDEAGITEWVSETSEEIQAYYEENRPAFDAWLAQAGQEVREAWDTLLNADEHTEEEVEEARETVTESLEQAGKAE